jgi:leucine efflux protein
MGSMLGITNVWTYVLGTVAIILLPGPNSMYVLSVAARRGVRMGYTAAAGVFLGDGILMTLSAAGVASLLRTEPTLFMIVKYAGAAYLCWIGFGLVRKAWRRWRGPAPVAADGVAADGVAAGPGRVDSGPGRVDAVAAGPGLVEALAAGPGPVDERGPFRRALLVSLLNPKAILFFISFFIQFVAPGYPYPAVSFLVLGTIAELVSAAYLTTLIFMGSYLSAQFRRRHKLSTALSTLVGTVFVGFAVKLATASLN